MDPGGMNDSTYRQADHVNILFKLNHENNDQNRQQYNALCVIDDLCLHCFVLTVMCF